MTRSVRNRLGSLLLEGFGDHEKRTAIVWLVLFCNLAGRRGLPEVPLIELLAEGDVVFPRKDGRDEAALGHLIGPERLLRARHADTDEVPAAGMPPRVEGIPWLIEPGPDVLPLFRAVCERAGMYAELMARLERAAPHLVCGDPLRRAMAEAAMCFNAGLFYEAHEHLEHNWMVQPRGPVKQFLQGIIQISVGCHHAHAGNYDGAVNQLAKGLEKAAGLTGEVLGLDCDAFLPGIAAVRERILRGGRAGMRPISLAEIPRMPVRMR